MGPRSTAHEAARQAHTTAVRPAPDDARSRSGRGWTAYGREYIRRAAVAAAVVVIAGGTLSRGQAQTSAPPAPGARGALSALDHIEIRQLVARYAYAVDTGAGDGAVYASLFAPDGAFVDRMGREVRGRDALIALARRNARGPQSAFHHIVNHIIEPSPEGGAVGRQYLLQLRVGDGDRPNEIFGGGHYRDRYVKTPDGWRFLRRQYIPSEGTPATLREIRK